MTVTGRNAKKVLSHPVSNVCYVVVIQEEQIVSTAREAEEGPEESPVGEDPHRRPEPHQQPDLGEDEEAAAHRDRTIPELADRPHGDLEPGKLDLA